MKLFTQWRFILLSALFSLLGMGSAWAQLTKLEVGGVYHFVNANYTDKAMGATNPQSVAGVAKDSTNKAQLWYVERKGDNGYALRNLGFGTYLQANGQSTRWTLASTADADNSWIKLETKDSNNAFKGYTYGNYGYAHIDGSSNVVGWETGATATQWTITPKEMTQAEIQNALNIFTSVPTIQTNLDNLFSDKSCTTLKGAFDENDASFKALPTSLQAMVRKVAGNASWEEKNFDTSKAQWGADYAKKYRVQLYEPYNDIDEASTALGLNTHTNMNNPTGIFANNGDVLYVMVEDEVKEGATLYLSYHTGHDKLSGATDGYQLQQGLNVLPIYQDNSNFYVNYVVKTFDTSDGKRGHRAKKHKLSEFPALKIHIEGGHINGYWNKMGDDLYPADTNDSWDYLEARASQKDLVILGQYMILNFPLNDADTEGNKGMRHYLNDLVKVKDVINAWDNVMLWERMLLGVAGKSAVAEKSPKSPYATSDHVIAYTGDDATFPAGYDDYYNIHGLAFGVGGNTYMYGSGDHSGYHYNTMPDIIKDLPTNAGSHWGPAHEIGHQHQNLIHMRGETEVTNNLFSNMVLWMYGETTSRVNGTEGSLENVLKNFNNESGHYLTNSIWGMTHMYYKLFLYYHVLGHNPKFYPRLFEMLRQDPQKNNRAGQVDGANAQLHLYKKVCAAAEEDLTEFFRAHGFFKPLNNWSIDDYGWSTYNMTQAQIDAAIAEVKSNQWEENTAVLFINDATGETIKSHKGNDINLTLFDGTTGCAEVGGYGNFNNDAANYTYSISGTTVTMEGTGGVGFAIFNEKGELIGFSDKKTFEISDDAALLMALGKAKIVTINADQSEVKAKDILDTASKEEYRTILSELLNKVKEDIIDFTDNTNSQKPGFYKGTSTAALTAAYEKAKTAYEEENSSAYSTVTGELNIEYHKALNSTNNRVPIVAGTTYVLTSKKYPNKSMNNTDSGLTGAETNSNSSSQQWVLESAGSENTFYIKSKSTNYYLGNLEQSTKISATADKAGATPYLAFDLGAGLWALQCQTESNKMSLHCDGSSNIVGWFHTASDNDGSWWHLNAVESESSLSKFLLEDLIEQTEALINEVGVITTHTQKVDLTENSYHSNAECKVNGDQFTSYNVLCDNDPSTFFHSDYSDQAPNEDHYIRMDVGAGNELKEFNLYYTTRKEGNLCAPTKMAIEGSNDDTTWDIIRDITSGLPTSNNTAHTITGLKGDNAYRYIRMRVYMNSSNQYSNAHYYFVVSELGLQEVTYQVAPNTLYATIEAKALQEAFNQQNAAIEILSTATSQDDINNAYTALLSKYNALKDAKQTVENATLNAKKEVLKALINNTTTLIGQCGSVVYIEETTPQLNTSAAPYKLSDNNGTSEGSLDKLYDGKQGKDYSYTSNWSNTPTQASYLQVDLGSGNELEELIFTFTNRNEGNAPTPTEIVVSASADGNTFTPLVTYTSEETNWPPAANNQNIAATKWTSPVIEATSACRYWRFTVTKSQRSSGGETNNKGIYHFGISEFGIVIPANCKVTVNEGLGEVTEELLLATYDENQEAQSTHTYATTEAQLDKAIAELQAQYEALQNAYNALAPELQAAMEAAQTFLNATPQTVGYPSATQRNAFQTAIDAHESVEAINTAKTEFINTTDIVMPENGKAYKISAWWRNETRSMEFVGTENTSIFAGSVPAYVPTTSETATIFVCRDLGNGEYAFISDNGYYLGWQADGKKNNTSTSFSVNSYNNTLKVQKAVPNNMDTMLSSEEVFGTFNILGKNGDGSGKYYHFMFKKSSKNYHSGNEGDAHYGDDAHTVFYTFEEVSGYTLNKVNLTATSTAKDKLLKGITDKQTISTFSAPYATVIPEGVTAYYASQEYDGNMLYLKAIQEGLALPANEGVILVGNEDVKASDFVPATTETVAVIDNKFSNSASSSVLMENNDYILANGSQGIGIYKAQANTRLKQGKAFLRMGSTSNAPSFIMNFGGNATGVEITLTDGATGEQVVYDLYGRRVTEVTKGRLYIVNGKKVFIK